MAELGALAAGLFGHDIVSCSAGTTRLRDAERRRLGREQSSACPALALALGERRIGCVGFPLCSISSHGKVAREIRVSRVVADRAIAEVFTDRESNSLRSSGEDEDERSQLMVSRENFSGAVEAEEFSLKGDGSEGRVVGPGDDQSSAIGDLHGLDTKSGECSVAQSWKDKLREEKKNHWFSDLGPGRLCMVEQIVGRLQCAGVHGSTLNSLLAPFAGMVSVRVATLVFRRLPKVTEPLGFYDWVKKHQPGLEANRPMYHALVQCLLQKRHWAGVETILYEMGSKENCLPDGALYRKMIKTASDAGNSKLANKWLQKMLQSGLVPILPTWNLVLAAFARDGRFAEVFSVYEQLKDHDRPADRITYCALLSACRNAGRVHEAREIVAQMKSRGMQPNRIVYSVLVDLYGKAGMPDSATATFREMEKAGYEPDQVAYNTLIHAYARAGWIEDANDAFDRAIKLGGHIDPVIFSTMINMYANVGSVETARDLLEAMKEFQFEKKHYQYAYSILINAYTRVGQLREPIKLFEEMQAAGYPVNDRIYTTMLNVYFKVGRHRCAEALFQDMIETGKCRNVVAFGTMINIYGRMGRLEDAVRIFNSLKASGLKGNTVIYNTLIYCQGRNGNLSAVEEYVKEMKAAPLELDRVTYSSLIKAYNKSGRPCDAIRTYNEMRSAGVHLDKLVVGTMVNTFGKLKRYEELVQLLEDTRQERVWPDERLLRSVVDVYDAMQLADCSPDAFSTLGELVIAMEKAVYRQHGAKVRYSCTENRHQSALGYESEGEIAS
ncbi:protein MpPPR_33 [Marchantia polymorpha subsp. ruderalis]|uniref:Pentacotripeptide-repeat region of PRORP domain-containing protein n=2 Tax=Marchantia polymorpha TaxID=3197 RepID=A0AAF6B5U4_MARPO|nr:hypothetical protein MARPO_0044s0135 [Marchantia polymorpha]BBN07378.1 hypothetical protein Mp_4g03380 [Marchantia polymorpha subsp. ruderalis]|eukprot:PTQ39722.1 hypothetical protein MARPO_0044s0135 [Marchantia polymorpha]